MVKAGLLNGTTCIDRQVSVVAGDIIPYMRIALVIYDASNSWIFSKPGEANAIIAEKFR